jgi:DNA-binding NtrC family response regulator
MKIKLFTSRQKFVCLKNKHTFIGTLTVRDGSPCSSGARRSGLMKSTRDKPITVVVVEDEPTVRELAESIVADAGYKTLSAATAREAIALLEQDESIELLFTDIYLPDGPDAINGLELARQAVELRPRLRVIYTTGGGRTDGMAALFVDGGIFLPKPYRSEQLIQAIETASDS